VALVCTSGTAAANFYPAIIEAHMSQIPLLILTSDRPPELRHSGANQTIDQVKMYGDQVLWAVDMGLPHPDAPAVALTNIAATATRAVATANGLRKGAVHINFPFRKPLQPSSPEAVINFEGTIQCKIERGALLPTDAQIETLTQLINQHERGLIICGPRSPAGDFPRAVTQLAERSGYPLVADPLSGVRFMGKDKGRERSKVICGYETFLANGANADEQLFAAPSLVIRFGAVPTSKWLNEYLLTAPIAQRIHIRENGVWADDSHLTTHFVQANEAAICAALTQQIARRVDLAWAEEVYAVEQHHRQSLASALQDAEFDVAYMVDLVNALPEGARLFMGNSLPIRHLDQFGMPTGKALSVYGNRGASGIDGTVSSALGVSVAEGSAAAGCVTEGSVTEVSAAETELGRPLVLAIGDVTLAHDLNGLMGAKNVASPVTIVLFNNGGGNIFRRLPIAAFEPPFTELFLTPHQLDFASLVQGHGWHYARAESRTDFLQKLETYIYSETPTVIEVQTDGAADEAARRELLEKLTR